MRHLLALGILLGFLTAGYVGPVEAQSSRKSYRHSNRWVAQKKKKKSKKIISSGQAAKSAKKKYRGKVLSTKLKKPKKGSPYYKVKILSDGRVRVVPVDAESGRVKR